ncbi:isoleucine--tRNA ligase [Candidatus Peregrinibacteria bacterium]|nr:isoleucine--tRNA ligase [Candidatus Peregrinibacteria bacterium]
MFQPVNPKQSFPKMEEEIIKYWKANKTFEKSVEKGKKDYVFYDGPPFATGLPHYGHLLAGTLKDVVPRYWTMRGRRIERKWGWDCHGLPVENIVEKELNLGNKTDIENYGIGKFNEYCRKIVLKYADEWKKTVERMGRWVDMENDYKTMNPEYMESIWWVFKNLWNKGLIYEGNKVVPYCIRCATPLSNFETNQGYQDKQDPALTVKFELADEPGTYLLAWTTTPWTLPSNLAIAVGPDLTYVKVRDVNDEKYILALDRLPHYYKDPKDYEIIEEFLGKKLKGRKYRPLMPYYADKKEAKVFTVTLGNFVTLEEGTGLVHMAPFGEDDMETLKKMDVEPVYPIDAEGKFNAEVNDFEGDDVFTANPEIIKKLKDEKKIVKHETINHSYPFCWRCETPLIYRPISTWFVKVEKIKDKLQKNNQKINWMPEHLKDGRFGKWLEGARDWAISRNRYWGAPLPIWRNVKNPEDLIVVGSIKELEDLSGKKVTDLHKHKVDPITIKKDGKTYKRIPEVLDCWFESGSMPYAQLHYPFENEDKFKDNFPGEFIAEGLDQTRGWFYTLHVLSNAMFSKPAFKNVIVNGIVLAEDGMKMSKRLNNYPDPNEVLKNYGADALRFYLMNSPVVKADDMRFSEKGVSDVVRNLILPVWNAYSFFVTYANIDKWTPDKEKNPPFEVMKRGKKKPAIKNKLDQWILQELNKLIVQEIEYMESYDLQKASNLIYKFVDNLTNWYIRRSRRRFWKSEDDDDKQMAYQTLYTVLIRLCQVIAPFMPFVSEEIYRNLTGEESVHLSEYPEPAEDWIRESSLQEEMFMAKTIVSLGLAARAKVKIKVRQPLAKIEVALGDQYDPELLDEQKEIIKEELNVKEVKFIKDPKNLATVIAKLNAKLLGPKYGKDVQKIIIEAKAGKFERLENGSIKVLTFELTPDEIEIAYVGKDGADVETEEGILIALDTDLTLELKQEGVARDLVRQIQDLRKAADYDVDNRIIIALINADPDIIELWGDYIKEETLANSIEKDISDPDQFSKLDGVVIKVKR